MDLWPIPERSAMLSRLFYASTTPLLVLCICTLAIRFYLRIRPTWKIGMDDWCILIGTLFAIVDWALLTFEMYTIPGPEPFANVMHAIKLAFFAIPIWACATSWIKMGVCFTLLRIRSSPRWNAFLYTTIGVHVLFQISVVLFELLQCRPISAAWLGVTAGAKCLSPRATSIMVTTTAAISITTDLLVSFAPIRFLITLNRPVRERLLVGVLMSFGLIASAISIRKAILVQRWGKDPEDMWNQGIAIATLVIAEQFVGSFAASAICLKAALRRLLAHFDIALDWHLSDQGSHSNLHYTTNVVYDSETSGNYSKEPHELSRVSSNKLEMGVSLSPPNSRDGLRNEC